MLITYFVSYAIGTQEVRCFTWTHGPGLWFSDQVFSLGISYLMGESMRHRTSFLQASVLYSGNGTPTDASLSSIQGGHLLTGKWTTWAADWHRQRTWIATTKAQLL